MAQQVPNRVAAGQIAHELGVCSELLVGQGPGPSANVFDANGVVVQADAVACHLRLGHQTVDGTVAVHEEVCREIYGARAPHAAATPADPYSIEGLPRSPVAARTRPVDHDGLGHDGQIVLLDSVVSLDVAQAKGDALGIEADRLIDDPQALGPERPGQADSDQGRR